jgi:hypothetical protein
MGIVLKAIIFQHACKTTGNDSFHTERVIIVRLIANRSEMLEHFAALDGRNFRHGSALYTLTPNNVSDYSRLTPYLSFLFPAISTHCPLSKLQVHQARTQGLFRERSRFHVAVTTLALCTICLVRYQASQRAREARATFNF